MLKNTQKGKLAKPAQLGAAHLNASELASSRHIDMINRRNKHIGGTILFYHDPVHIVRGEGVWLYDDQGRKYLDCYNNVPSVGHCHPEVVDALTSQAAQLNTHTRYLHENVIDYAEKLAGLMPDPLEVVMFTCTGSEAIDLAVRLARNYTGNNGIVCMENSYHGNTTLVNELSTVASPSFGQRPDHIIAVEPPNDYRGPYRQGEHDQLGQRYADLVTEAALKLEARGQNAAALLCDTIFDSQGVLDAPRDYFAKAQQAIKARGGLFIADEVQAGLCRTGKWWGFQNFDVVPDIVVLGKPMGDGHAIAAVVTTREIIDSFSENGGFYFNTFSGNPVSAAVGHKVLEICEKENLSQNCEKVGAYLKQQLTKLAEKHPLIGNIRGQGLFVGVELVHDRNTKAPASDIARLLPDAMKEQGVLIGMSGRYGNVLKLRPPMVFSKADTDLLIKALDRALKNICSGNTNTDSTANIGTPPRAQSLDIDQAKQSDTVYQVLTERIVTNLIKQGVTHIRTAQSATVTPLAKELVRAAKIQIEKV